MTGAADQPIRVLICDDHAVVRQGLRAFLASQAGIEVVAEANTGNDAVRLAEELTPDVVVLDLLMPAGDGFDATVKIRAARPQTQIVILTSYTAEGQILRASLLERSHAPDHELSVAGELTAKVGGQLAQAHRVGLPQGSPAA